MRSAGDRARADRRYTEPIASSGLSTRITEIADESQGNRATELLGSVLGPLELRLIELLWARGTATTVRDACTAFPSLAYTTLMTTLDRLYRKGLLRRRLCGRAFAYVPRLSREQWLRARISRQIGEWLASESGRSALLSHFVRSVGKRDTGVLDELEALVQAEKLRLLQHRRNER